MTYIFIHTHPVQYMAPLYRYLTEQGLPLQVWYCEPEQSETIDHAFGRKVEWDIDLLQGYARRHFANKGYGRRRAKRGVDAYWNPDMLKALRNHPPAIVVVPGWSYRSYIAILRHAAGWGHRLWFRGETHLGMELARPKAIQVLRRALLRRLLQPVERFLAIGSASRDFYQWLDLNRPVVMTPYAVDHQRFAEAVADVTTQAARSLLDLPAGGCCWLFVGKWIDKKRPLDLLEAFGRLPENQRGFLVLVGSGMLEGTLRKRAAALGLENVVRFAGFVNQQFLPLYYRAATALVLPSDYGETWGLVVNEAMACGLPAIVSDRCGCAPDLVEDGVTGWRFSCGQVDELAGRMHHVATLTPADRDQLGHAARQRVLAAGYAAIYAGMGGG